MYILTEVMGVISEVLIIWIFIQGNYISRNTAPWIDLIGWFLYGCGLMVLSFIEGAVYERIMFCGCGIVLLTFFLYEANLLQSVCTGIAFCAIYMMTDVFIFLLSSLYGFDSQTIMQRSPARCVYIITTHIFLLAIISLVLLLKKNRSSAITLPFVLIMLPGYIISILLGLSFCKYLEVSGENLPTPFLFASSAMLYMNIILVFYAEQAKKASDRKRKIEIAEHHYTMQEQYYEQLRLEQNETRSLFHDISKHLRAMQALVNENELNQAQNLLKETQTLYRNIGNVVDVGNYVISVLLNEYKNRAQEEGIEFIFSVSISEDIKLAAVDCYIILGNTLDNAFEGTLSVPEGNRKISLQLRQHQQTLFYKIENTCSPVHAQRKRDKNHGFGLQNVRKCLNKYSGDMITSIEEGKFVLMAHLTC